MVFSKSKMKHKSDGDSPSHKQRSMKKRVDPKDGPKGGVPKNFGDSMVPKPREGYSSKKGKK